MLGRFLRLASKALGIGLRNRQASNPIEGDVLVLPSRNSVRLGPPPDTLQRTIAGWIEDARTGGPSTLAPEFDGVFIYGDTVVCCYLKASGEIVRWDAWDDIVTTLDDGPDKVSLVVVATQHRPELGCWLPVRPVNAKDCARCEGGGWMLPPWPRVICPECSGLGWVTTPGV
jgi:hypothetical protein